MDHQQKRMESKVERKKIVLASDSEDDSDDDVEKNGDGINGFKKPSFITGTINQSLKTFNSKCTDKLSKQISSHFSKEQKKLSKKEVEAVVLSKTTITTTTTTSTKTRPAKGDRKSAKPRKAKKKEKPEEEELIDVICMSDGEEKVVKMPKKRLLENPPEGLPPKVARTGRGGAVEVITLDDEEVPSTSSPKNPSSDSSLNCSNSIGNLALEDDDSFNVSFNTSTTTPSKKEDTPIELKVKRQNVIKRVTIRQGQPLSAAFEQISAQFGIPVQNIVLYHKEEVVDPRSTPLSLSLTIADILQVMFRSTTAIGAEDTALTVSSSRTNAADINNQNSNDPNFVTLHFRDNSKKKVTICCNRFQSVQSLAEQYAKERGLRMETVVFKFDSEEMAFSQLVDAFDLEDDDQIDVDYR